MNTNPSPKGKGIDLLCPHCGNDDIVRDASARWNVYLQEWVLRCTYDDMHCEVCGADFREAAERPIAVEYAT